MAADALVIRAGPQALAHLREHGLRAQDIAVVPGAAGGPKGLILQALDQWLFGEWLPSAPRPRLLIGASIGAWRMAAACHSDPAAAFRRLGTLYCEQTYPARPSPAHVTAVCRQILQDFVGGREAEVVHHPRHRLQIIASRSARLPDEPPRRRAELACFAAAMLANAASRRRLARHFERVVLGDRRAGAPWEGAPFDGFVNRFAALDAGNLIDALLASGTLPLVMEPVAGIAGAPSGLYWDGGLIDYHLALPYPRLADSVGGGLVLYPHFTDHLVPGWFDKSLRWRRGMAGTGWLDRVIL
ncbi:MAG: patatin-like phospholipase family protein, partial [Burkholderiaceae bacterium]